MNGIIQKYIDSTTPAIADTAKQLAGYTQKWANRDLSDEEYHDLCSDLLSLGRIDQLCDDTEEKILIQEAFNAMVAIASAIPIG